MRIVQVIDSLETGGAERMAVNYANGLAKKVAFSGLVSTRAEGSLKIHIDKDVNYLFLNKKSALDLRAVLRFRRYCRENDIQYIHAHSTSYFLAILVKCIYPKVHILWHDHNGNSEFLEVREAVPLNFASFFFKGIIVVNNQLKDWAIRKLHCKYVLYIPNFTNEETAQSVNAQLNGEPGKRILSLANLRQQKDHFLLLKVAEQLKESRPDWTFHLVGKDFGDDYSQQVRTYITQKNLESTVFVYGSRNDTVGIIKACDIAILTSKSEGLPVALLEYGLYGKPVVVTSVGELPLIVRNEQNGFIVNRKSEKAFYAALIRLIDDAGLRETYGMALYATILGSYSEEAAVSQYLQWIETISHV
jgi:glycosyltransferase involved in cell wall biosynthesis